MGQKQLQKIKQFFPAVVQNAYQIVMCRAWLRLGLSISGLLKLKPNPELRAAPGLNLVGLNIRKRANL